MGPVHPPGMRFDRYPSKDPRPVTPPRMAAARRAVKREAESVALFPELRRFTTPEERLAQVDEDSAGRHRYMRAFMAAAWRQARREIKTLRPLQAEGILRWWAKGVCPGDPTYLLGSIRDARERSVCYWRKLAESRRLYLFGRGLGPWPKPE